MNVLLLKAILFYFTAILVAGHLPHSARLIKRAVRHKLHELFRKKPIQAQIISFLAVIAGLILVASHGMICALEGTANLNEYRHASHVA